MSTVPPDDGVHEIPHVDTRTRSSIVQFGVAIVRRHARRIEDPIAMGLTRSHNKFSELLPAST